jgi:uncharacterized protein
MSQQGMVIDSLEFARRHGTLSGSLDPSSLPRLAELLFEGGGNLEFAVTGETTGAEAFLALSVDGLLQLTCQRCLGGLRHPVHIRSRLLLVAPGARWPDEELEEDEYDAVEAAHELNLVPLLEEEILLALPIAPRHAECSVPGFMPAAEAVSPFAGLAGLKRKLKN